MNKKEIAEIKKCFTPANCAITRMCGCYVDAEKNIITQSKEAFLSIEEEQVHKYFKIFRSTLSGSLGKNLMNMEFPLEQELGEGTQTFLLKLRDSELKDDELIDEFYQKIIEHYAYGENYYIILIHIAYDIPSKATDGTTMEDASDYVYNAILCSICPVKLSKSGLSYHEEDNIIGPANRDWLVEAPATGFLFPAFNDRNTDIHGLLYYSKDSEKLQTEFIDSLLGCEVPLTSKTQKETFLSIIEETLGEECDFATVKTIHENLAQMIEEKKEDPEPPVLQRQEVKRLFEESGVSEEQLEQFDTCYQTIVDEHSSFMASNITNTRSFEVKTPDVSIKVNPDMTHLVETKWINGRPCIVIEVNESVEVNGIRVTTSLPHDNIENDAINEKINGLAQ